MECSFSKNSSFDWFAKNEATPPEFSKILSNGINLISEEKSQN